MPETEPVHGLRQAWDVVEVTPAEELAAAADKLDALASAATRGSWTVARNSSTSDSHGPTTEHSSWAVLSPEIDDENPVTMVAGPERDPRNGSLWGGIWEPADAEYIAAMNPLVGKALAHVLRREASAIKRAQQLPGFGGVTLMLPQDELLVIARLINGSGA